MTVILIDALATQIWEIDPDESQMTVFNGTYSQMKEEQREGSRLVLSAQQVIVSDIPDIEFRSSQSAKREDEKEERRKIAQLQELENTIAELESKLANLSTQLESPFVKPAEAAKFGTEYERVQREMDEKLGEWEQMQA